MQVFLAGNLHCKLSIVERISLSSNFWNIPLRLFLFILSCEGGRTWMKQWRHCDAYKKCFIGICLLGYFLLWWWRKSFHLLDMSSFDNSVTDIKELAADDISGENLITYRIYHLKWATTWENVPSVMCAQWRHKSACASRQSDQSICCLYEETLHPRLSTCTQWRFWSDCANAQSDQNLRWTHMFEGTFFDVNIITLFVLEYLG